MWEVFITFKEEGSVFRVVAEASVVRVLKIAISVSLAMVLCVLLGYQTALWAAINGLYECNDVSCPVIVMVITGPLISLGYAVLTGCAFLAWRYVSRSRKDS